jgi:transposase
MPVLIPIRGENKEPCLMTMTSTSVVDRAHNGMVSNDHDDAVDPAAKATRRRFSREFKVQIVEEYDAADRSERGALLRREGLYTSHISEWRNQLASAEQPARTARRRSAEQAELERLRKRNARLESELRSTRLALEITGKAHALLEMLSESAGIDPKSKQ